MPDLTKELKTCDSEKYTKSIIKAAKGLQRSDRRQQRTSTATTSALPTAVESVQELQRSADFSFPQTSQVYRGSPLQDSSGNSTAKTVWDDVFAKIKVIADAEARTKEVNQQIFDAEEAMKALKEAGKTIPPKDIDDLDAKYRENVRTCDNQKARANDDALTTAIGLLIDMQKHKEQQEQEALGRVSSSRTSAGDYSLDGPSDSPGPSPAENRQVRKIGASRTSSQPPRNPAESSVRSETAPSEAGAERSTGRPKIVYSLGDDVAFKRKIPGSKTDEQDWILGNVVKVIGEGKSRRYEVKDPEPDQDNPGGNIYKSSASQMVPIPVEGSRLDNYEIGRSVLALYPETTTFYKAEVKATLEGGAKVQLLFVDETAGELKEVARRFVLDHKI